MDSRPATVLIDELGFGESRTDPRRATDDLSSFVTAARMKSLIAARLPTSTS